MSPSLFDELESSVWNKLRGFMVVLIQMKCIPCGNVTKEPRNLRYCVRCVIWTWGGIQKRGTLSKHAKTSFYNHPTHA